MSQEAKIIGGIGIIMVVLIIGAAFFLGGNSQQSPNSEKVDPKLLVRENSNRTSSESAKVTLVEFGDYQCPACGAAHPLVKQIVSSNKGKLTFVFRNFPLPQHKNAEIAAEAAEAAGAQGKYFEMHDTLYDHQKDWAESSTPLEIFISYAKELKLDEERFKQDVQNNKYSDKIVQDQQDGNSLGVNATPTFYINGSKFQGNDLKTAVESTFSGN